MVTGDGYGKSLGSLCFLLFLLISSFGGWLREMVTGDGYEKSLFSFFSFNFFFWGMVTGDGYGRWLREVSGKSRFSSFSFNFFFWGMVTGDGYGRWLREVSGNLKKPVVEARQVFKPHRRRLFRFHTVPVLLGDGYGRSLCFLLFLLISSFGGWLREMVTGDGYGKSLGILKNLLWKPGRFLNPIEEDCPGSTLWRFFWGMVTGDGYGKSVFSSFSFNFFFWGMVTGSLWEFKKTCCGSPAGF